MYSRIDSRQYIYNLNYDDFEKDFCALEMKSLFNGKVLEKVFFENIKVDPSISPFLKNRLQILCSANTFDEVITCIIAAEIEVEDFMVKYVQLHKKDSAFKRRREYCKAIGMVIEGDPHFTAPKITYGIALHKDIWHFGVLTESDPIWKEHNNKPFTYSSSLGINMAKVLVNIAGSGDTTKSLVDPCCGVGTVLLEGVFAGYSIKGWELNRKIAQDARRNLDHFNYEATVTTGNIKDIEENFDASIIDMPYGNFSLTDEANQLIIISNARRISNRVVIVSSKDISKELTRENLKVIEYCKIRKSRLSNFSRFVWVCE